MSQLSTLPLTQCDHDAIAAVVAALRVRWPVERVRVIGSYLSPYVRKVLVVLDLKGLRYEIDPIVPFYGNDEFARITGDDFGVGGVSSLISPVLRSIAARMSCSWPYFERPAFWIACSMATSTSSRSMKWCFSAASRNARANRVRMVYLIRPEYRSKVGKQVLFSNYLRCLPE